MKTTTITLPNGSTAISFVGEDSTQQAIVHLSVIKRLAKLLPTAHPKAIINDLISELDDICSSNLDYPLEAAVAVAEDFSAFHKTVNLITLYKPDDLSLSEKSALAGIEVGIHAAKEAAAGNPRAIDEL